MAGFFRVEGKKLGGAGRQLSEQLRRQTGQDFGAHCGSCAWVAYLGRSPA